MRSCMGAHHHSAFTLSEVLVVLTVIATLAALGLPAWFYMRTQARVGAARTLVVAVQNAIATYDLKTWQVIGRDPASPGTFGTLVRVDINMWDLNGDQVLDGDPSLDLVTPFPADIHASANPGRTTYRGFYDMAGLALPSRSGINAKRQVLDPWAIPLGIRFGAEFGPARVGIWSYGPDKVTATADDVCSWK